jgi:hypothetical protein
MPGKRVFIVHGWSGTPSQGWLKWLAVELEKLGFAVYAPVMPNPDKPMITPWVDCLRELVGPADEDTYFVGHSIGCQTILRYLGGLPSGEKVRGATLVAGWTKLNVASYENKEDEEIARDWIETPIEWERIRAHTGNFTAILSDNDPFVPLSMQKVFSENLGAKIIVKENAGHFSETETKELPDALQSVVSSFS